MLGGNLFFKKQEKVPIASIAPFDNGTTNTGVRPSMGSPRFGFQTMFPSKVLPLPTAPPVVGGNVDWTKSKVTPVTLQLHNALSATRPMSPAPQLGSFLKLSEPNNNSIHTY